MQIDFIQLSILALEFEYDQELADMLRYGIGLQMKIIILI
jgi:hypothetical protein